MLVCCAHVKPSYFLMPPWFWCAIFVSHFAWWQRTWWSPSCWFEGVENLTDRFDGYSHRVGWRKYFCGCFPKQPFGAPSSKTQLFRENRSSLLILERHKMFAKLRRVRVFLSLYESSSICEFLLYFSNLILPEFLGFCFSPTVAKHAVFIV